MKSTILQVTIFLLLAFSINAQSTYFNVIESEKFADNNGSTEVIAVYTSNQNQTIVVRSARKKLIFEIYDDNAKNLFNIFADLKKKEEIVGELFYNNDLRVFSVFSPSKTERIINCYTINIESKSIKKVELFKTSIEKKQQLFSGQNKRQTNFAISENEKILVVATDNIKKHSNSYLIHVFDAHTLKLLYSKNYYSDVEKFFRSSDMTIDNDGNVYALGKEYVEGKKEKKNEKPNYTFILTKINQNNNESTKIDLNENEHVKSLRIIPENGSLNLIGFYSENKIYNIKGIVEFKIDKNSLSILEKKLNPLPEKVYTDLYSIEKAKKKSQKELKNFYLDYVLKDNEGNTYLLAEEFYITQYYMSNGMNGGYWVTTYHYDNILISKLSAQGNIIWGRSILKKDTHESYNAFLLNNKLHVLLNSGKTLKEKDDGRKKAAKGFLESTSLYDFVYDENGDVEHQKIQDNKNKTIYIPFLGNYKNGKFIMFNHSKANKQLMMLIPK